jgi:hypothetical protein
MVDDHKLIDALERRQARVDHLTCVTHDDHAREPGAGHRP